MVTRNAEGEGGADGGQSTASMVALVPTPTRIFQTMEATDAGYRPRSAAGRCRLLPCTRLGLPGQFHHGDPDLPDSAVVGTGAHGTTEAGGPDRTALLLRHRRRLLLAVLECSQSRRAGDAGSKLLCLNLLVLVMWLHLAAQRAAEDTSGHA